MKLNIRRLLSRARRGIDDYHMIEAGDRIAVGVSGGKDSLALLCVLAEMRRFYPKPFQVCAITLDPGFPGGDFSPLEDFFRELDVEYRIVPTDLFHVVFEVREEKNPCSLCARMRRGLLHDHAKAMGCNKLALGHHFDDVLVTFLMNLFNEGHLGTFSPVTYLDRKDITVIRPFVMTKESEIVSFVRSNPVPVMKSLCPEDKHTDREKYREMLTAMEKENDGLSHKVFLALQKAGLSGYGVEPSPRPRRQKKKTEEATEE